MMTSKETLLHKEQVPSSELLVVVWYNSNSVQTLECYYCNDEQGYYCPQPFPLKSIFIVSCKTNYYNNKYEYQNTYRGAIKHSMNASMICQSNRRLSQNPNYPGWEETFCCYHTRCNHVQSLFQSSTISSWFIIQILLYIII
ncbi:hypothetical protein I4U23_028326 [Adineta vaga]|nr:hypothetical protein I4U23_028326 [Adineta vaga]